MLRRRVLRWPLGLEYTEEDLAAEDDQVHLVGIHDNQVVAVALLHEVPEGAKMRQVAVAPEFQGQGYGRQLVEAFEDLARRRGLASVVLHAREGAIPFYQALRYRTTGESFLEVGIPHIKMEKSLR